MNQPTVVINRTPWNSLKDPQRTPKSAEEYDTAFRIVTVCTRGALPGSLRYTAHLLLSAPYYKELTEDLDDGTTLPVKKVVNNHNPARSSASKVPAYVDLQMQAYVLPKASFIDMKVYRNQVAHTVRRLRKVARITKSILLGDSDLEDHPFYLHRDPTRPPEDDDSLNHSV